MSKPRSHPVIEWLIEASDLTRTQLAQRIGITPKTLYYWEHQITKVKPWMIALISQHSGTSLDTVPAYVNRKALEDAERNYATRSELKEGFKAPPKPVPATPKAAYGSGPAPSKYKPDDPKRHRIRNHGTPTKANKNPRTYSQFSTAMTDIVVKGRDIPSDMEYPDLVAAALDKLGFYEAVYVAAHTIPYVTGSARATLPFTRRTYPAFYWQRPNGVQSMADTIDEAKARIKQQIAEDEASTADLI